MARKSAAGKRAVRVFISYSWDTEPHKVWVRTLAEALTHAGLNVRLDQWHMRPGESTTQFMEQELTRAKFCVVVLTPTYAKKSNARKGGVGYEQQIISGNVVRGEPRSKFIPILRAGEFRRGPNFAIPTLFDGITLIDFRDDAAFAQQTEELLRAIYEAPRYTPPPRGAAVDLPAAPHSEPLVIPRTAPAAGGAAFATELSDATTDLIMTVQRLRAGATRWGPGDADTYDSALHQWEVDRGRIRAQIVAIDAAGTLTRAWDEYADVLTDVHRLCYIDPGARTGRKELLDRIRAPLAERDSIDWERLLQGYRRTEFAEYEDYERVWSSLRKALFAWRDTLVARIVRPTAPAR